MPVEVIMPKVDMDMDRGRIAAWHVAEGEAVAKGDPLFDIETDKAAMEVEAPGDGTLRHITAQAGDEVAIGQAVAWIYAEGEEVGEAPAAAAGPETAATAPEAAPAVASSGDTPKEAEVPAASGAEAAKPRATPAARALAAEQGMSLSDVRGTGPRGRIQKADIVEALKTLPSADTAPAAAPPERVADQPGALSVLRSGQGEALPLVLIHGFAADATAWTLVERELAGERPIYRIELPGHGRSPQRRVGSFADLAAELRHAFDALGLERAHLAGHSLGGALALAVADTRPRAVARLTLIAPAGLGPEIDGEAIQGLSRASRAESLGPWLQQMVGDPDGLSWGFVQAAAQARAEPGLRAAQAEMAAVLFPDGVQSFDVGAALSRLEMPARIIWGRRDRVIPWRHALRAPGRVALNLYDALGHMPHVEAPGEMVSLLREGS